jgi:hypothetical protein
VSYWVYLEKDGSTVKVARHAEGGTYALGGLPEAELNVTYNYSGSYRQADFSLRDLHDKKAADTVSKLESVVSQLGTERDSDYWAATDGNAGYAASILLGWAKQHPEATWRVS